MNLLEKIKSGELTAIGWGTGEMFKYRKYIHDFDLLFTIDDRKKTDYINDVKIETPDILEKINQQKHILIAYSVEYLETIYTYCKKYEELIVLPFNSHEFNILNNLKNLEAARNTYIHHGISYINLKNNA